MRRTMEARFWAKVDKSGACWNWTAGTNHGYGQLSKPGHRQGTVRAHRFAYEPLVGPIPEGLTLDHLCRNKRCVNPAHLEPVTFSENTRRWATFNVPKYTCKHGHALVGGNIRVLKDGRRRCRRCINARQAARDADRHLAGVGAT